MSRPTGLLDQPTKPPCANLPVCEHQENRGNSVSYDRKVHASELMRLEHAMLTSRIETPGYDV